MSIGLYVGRFQPFHRGHISAIKQALIQVDKLFIGIGSAQYAGEPRNPYTAAERRHLIELGLQDEGLTDKCEIYEIPDIHDNQRWVGHVQSIAPHFDTAIVGAEGLVKDLFEAAGVPVIVVEQELDINATKIRQAMIDGEDWEQMVSPSVASRLKNA